MNRINVVSRFVVFLVALLLTTFPVVAVAQNAPTTKSSLTLARAAASPDLAAISLSQTDFDEAGLDGFGLTYGWLGTLNDVADLLAEDRGGTTSDNTERFTQLL